MGTHGSSRLPSENNNWVPHTFLSKTATCTSKCNEKQFQCSGIIGNDNYNTENDIRRCPGGSQSDPKLPIFNVSGSQSRRLRSTYFQLESPEQLHSNRKLQPFEHVPCTRLSAAKGLAVQDRFVSGILSPTDRSQSQTISPPEVSGSAFANDMLAIRLKHSSKNLCQLNKLGLTDSQKKRYKNGRILGRFFDCSSDQRCSSRPCENSGRDIGKFRFDDQLRKVCPSSCKKRGLPGNLLESVAESKATSRREDPITNCQTELHVSERQDKPEKPTKSCRLSKFRQFCCPKRQTELPSLTESSEHATEIRSTEAVASSTSSGPRQPEMVVTELYTPIGDSLASADPLSDNGCVRSCLGSSVGQLVTDRSMVRVRARSALQPKGNVGNLESFERSLSVSKSQHCTRSVRQHDCNRISPPRRRNEVDCSHELDFGGFSNTGPVSDTFEPASFTGQIQLPRRPSVEIEEDSRMACASSVYRNSVLQMGNTNNGPICLEHSSCGPELRFFEPEGSRRAIPRRIFTEVELHSSLDIPTTIPDSQSASPSQSGNRGIPASSTTLGASVLESRLEEPSIGSPIHAPEPEQRPSRYNDGPAATGCLQHDFRGVEMWGWSSNLIGWNDDQIKLLEGSWRPSTRRTYSSAWKKWLNWTNSNNIDSINPEASDVARFLADLHLIHKLSYSSILLHKSVISTLSNPNNSGQLSSHTLVKHVLKAIQSQKPTAPKPPIWNIDSLAAYLENCSVNNTNVFQVQRHTATLLLLCSGRRIHDLTLLSVDCDHCVQSKDYIILWPIFGSKTDSSDHRQSGWKLSSNHKCKNLDPVFWIKQTMTLLQNRRNLTNSSNLFVNIRGEAKSASRAIIAGWIKTLLVEAGISATPGSVRSAVASKNWVDNYPLEDILSRGNWRSGNTFCKFYRRQVMPVSTKPPGVTASFTPVD